MDLADLRRTWDQVATRDPWRAILGRPGEGEPWDADEFFNSGRWEIQEALRYAGSLGLPAGRGRALDFGCGAGRLTQALAASFEVATGVDVSPAMIELARRHNRHGARCEYALIETPDLAGFPSGAFDLVYSNITLQHMSPALILVYLREFIRVLAPRGLLLFQLPSHRVRPLAARLLPGGLYSRLSRRLWALTHPGAPVIEMHGLRPTVVRRSLEAAGGRLIAQEKQDSAGAGWMSYRYAATR